MQNTYVEVFLFLHQQPAQLKTELTGFRWHLVMIRIFIERQLVYQSQLTPFLANHCRPPQYQVRFYGRVRVSATAVLEQLTEATCHYRMSILIEESTNSPQLFLYSAMLSPVLRWNVLTSNATIMFCNLPTYIEGRQKWIIAINHNSEIDNRTTNTPRGITYLYSNTVMLWR